MPVIVDTYNVLHVTGVLPPHLAGVDVAGLAELIAQSRYGEQTVWLVCDGKPGPGRAQLRGRIVTHYAGAGAEADDDIGRMIDASTSPRRLIVVSSDRRVAAMARRRRCIHRTSEAFMGDLAADARRAESQSPAGSRRRGVRPPVPLDRALVERWVELFALGSDHLELPPSVLRRGEPGSAASPKERPAARARASAGASSAPPADPQHAPPATAAQSRKDARRRRREEKAASGAPSGAPNGAGARRPNDARTTRSSAAAEAEAARVIAALEQELPPELLGDLRRLGEGSAPSTQPQDARPTGQRDARLLPAPSATAGVARGRTVAPSADPKARVGRRHSLLGAGLDLALSDLAAFDFDDLMRTALEMSPTRRDEGEVAETPPRPRARDTRAGAARSDSKPSPRASASEAPQATPAGKAGKTAKASRATDRSAKRHRGGRKGRRS